MNINNRKVNLKLNFSKNRPLLGNNKTSTGKIDLSKNNSITIGNPNLTLTETTYTLNQLKNNYKFTDDIIKKYFKTAPMQTFTSPTLNNKTVTYIVNTATGCQTINDVVNIVFQDYQKDLVLDNFLKNANKKTDKATDLSKTKNGTQLSVNNYKEYIDEIGLATGEEAKDLRKAAVNKMIKDFTQGNLSLELLGKLFNTLGITDTKETIGTNSQGYTYSFTFEGKKYTMTCNIQAAFSGTDGKTVTTYTQEDLLANKGATEELINKYFEPVSEEAGKAINYKLKTGKTYTAFLEALKPKTEEKNGTFESKNEAGHLVETTYVDGKVTKVVEYNYGFKSKDRTETEYNKDGSKTVTIYDYNDKVKSTAKYDKNDKIIEGTISEKNKAGHLVETTYKDGKVTKIVEYNSSYKSKTRTETEYNKDGSKTVTKYDYGNEVISITKYDKNNNILDGTVESKNKAGNLVETTYKDGKITKIVEYNGDKKYGEKTETKYNKDGSQTINKYDYFGQVKSTIEYDKNGKITQETQYTSDGREVTKYNTDGSKLTYVYDKEDNITLEIHTSKDGKERYLQTIVNKDGSKTRLEYANKNKGGVIAKTEYDAQGRLTYNASYSGYYVTDKKITYNADGSRTEIQYEKHNKDSKAAPKASEKNYDKNGNLISEIVYKDNKKQSETHCTYDSKGLVSKAVIQYQNELKDKETVTDKNGNKLSETVYKGIWTDPNSGTKYKDGTYGAIIQTTYDGAKTTETIKINDGKTILRETITDTDKNTKTVITYSNGKKSVSRTTDAKNNVLEQIDYDSDGKMKSKVVNEYENDKLKSSTTYDKDNKVVNKIVYEYSADGKTRTEKIYDSKDNLISTAKTTISELNGREKLTTNNYNAENKLTSTVINYYDKSGNNYIDTYDKTGKQNNMGMITSRKLYDKSGKLSKTYTYTYSEITDNKNYVQTSKCSDGTVVVTTKSNNITIKQVTTKPNGDIATTIYNSETGKAQRSFYYTKSTGICKTTDYDKNGNALKGTAIDRLDASGLKVGSQEPSFVLGKLLDPYGYTLWVNNASFIKKHYGAGDITVLMLALANPKYSKTPTNCTKLTNSSQIDAKYRDIAKKIINSQINDFGYNVDQVKGYSFNSSSNIAQQMSKNKDFRNYVKKNLDNLIKGKKNANGEFNSFEFTKANGADLYYAFSQVHVIDSSLNGTKLTLTILDTYDFDENASDGLSKVAAAGMKDGQLKPYYSLTTVTIDLSKDPYNYTAAKLQDKMKE